jgi:HSP20 family protein
VTITDCRGTPPGPSRRTTEEVVVMVTRFDPFRDFDRLAERMLHSASDLGQTMRTMPMDLFRTGEHFVLRCDLPGVDPGTIEVGVDGRTLTVRAQRTAQDQDVEWLTRERATGSFARQLTLGDGLDLEHIEATYADGVLTLTLPVAEQAKPRKIEVAYTGTSRTIEGAASPTAG